jgi:hypothetical protein
MLNKPAAPVTTDQKIPMKKKFGKKPHIHFKMPASLRVVSRHFSTWLVIAGLIAVTLETIFVFNRGPDPNIEQQVRQRYPAPTAQFNQEAINRLDNLLPQAPVPPASGKSNPFVP